MSINAKNINTTTYSIIPFFFEYSGIRSGNDLMVDALLDTVEDDNDE